MVLAVILTAAAAYLLGSINFAIIITRLFSKEDIRTHGSGNAGMTNVLRTLGKGPAALVLPALPRDAWDAVFAPDEILTENGIYQTKKENAL